MENHILENWLREADLILQEAPGTPQQMKAKIGIKADAISDEDFQKLMNITTDKKQLAALARFSIEQEGVETVLPYAQRMMRVDPKLDPQRFKDFTKFTEHIDAKDTQHGYQKSQASFGLDTTPPDWQSPDGRYRVYDAKDINDCIKYGQGQTFCISRTEGGNMYNHYRQGQQSKYYFVFDTKLKPTDEAYITVVDAHPNGDYEFTHKSNNTPSTSDKYGRNLDNFLRTKPGLEAAKQMFQPMPLTDQEKATIERWKKVRQDRTFMQLSKQDKLQYIQYGDRNRVRPEELAQLDKDLQNEYINNGHHVGEAEFRALGPQAKTRVILDKLKKGEYFDSDDEFDFIAENPERFPLSLDGPQEGKPTIHRNLIFSILFDAQQPTKILRRFTPEQWLKAFTSDWKKTFLVMTKTPRPQDFYEYLGKENVQRIFAQQDIKTHEWLAVFEAPRATPAVFELPGIPWEAVANEYSLVHTFKVSPVAYTFCKQLLAHTEVEWSEIEFDLKQDDKTGMGLVNICATSNAPLTLAQKINLGEKIGEPTWNHLVLPRVLKNPELTEYLVNAYKLDRSAVFNTLLDKLPEQQVQQWGQQVEDMMHRKHQTSSQLSEAYMSRFKTLLNF